MQIDNIEIHQGAIEDRQSIDIGPVRARVTAGLIFLKTPTIEDANFKLREIAVRLGADAVVDVRYSRGMSITSWKALTADGIAVVVEPADRSCPMCGEQIKIRAVKCRYCASEVEQILSDALEDLANRADQARQLHARTYREVNPRLEDQVKGFVTGSGSGNPVYERVVDPATGAVSFREK